MGLSESLKPENLSIGGSLQDKAIEWTNSKTHPVLGFIGGRLLAITLKPPARVADVALHIILAVGKTFVGLTITLPMQGIYYCLNKKYQTNWNVKQGIFHLGYACVYTLDIFACPFLNLISPNIYATKKKTVPVPPADDEQKPLQRPRTQNIDQKSDASPLNHLLLQDEQNKEVRIKGLEEQIKKLEEAVAALKSQQPNNNPLKGSGSKAESKIKSPPPPPPPPNFKIKPSPMATGIPALGNKAANTMPRSSEKGSPSGLSAMTLSHAGKNLNKIGSPKPSPVQNEKSLLEEQIKQAVQARGASINGSTAHDKDPWS